MGFTFTDDELRIMIAFVEKRALDCRKRFPHFADLFPQFAISVSQLGILRRTLQTFHISFTH